MVEFSLYGRTIEFSEKEIEYSSVRKDYADMASFVVANFTRDYNSFNDAQEFREKGYACARKHIMEVLDFFVSGLVKQGRYDVSVDDIIDEYGPLFLMNWLEAYDEVNDKYLALELDEQQLRQMRTARRENRGRWVGGGFGVKGAVKGALTAGAFNMASGAVHGVVNTLGNMASSIAKNSAAQRIFRDKQNLEILQKGLFDTVFSFQWIHCEFYNIDIPEYNEKKVSSILDNLSKIPPKELRDVICDCIQEAPHLFDTYEYALSIFGDEKGEIDQLAKTFGFVREVKEFKQGIIELIYGADVSEIDSYDKAKEVKEQVQKNMHHLNLSESEVLDRVDEVFQKFDLEARTFNGITYSSVEEVEDVQKQELDVKERTFNGVTYSTREAVDAAKKDLEYVKQQYENIKSIIDIREWKQIRSNILNSCTSQRIIDEALESIEKAIYTISLVAKLELLYHKEEVKLSDITLLSIHKRIKEEKNAKWSGHEDKDSLHSLMESCLRAYQVLMEKRIIEMKCANFNFDDYTSINAEKAKKVLSDISQNFILTQFAEKKQLNEVVKKNAELKERAEAYLSISGGHRFDSFYESLRFVGGSFMASFICFRLEIQFLFKITAIVFLASLVFAGWRWLSAFLSMFSRKTDNKKFTKIECKNAYNYLKEHGEVIEEDQRN